MTDFLLSQQPASQRAATRSYLESSPQARAWARAVASELRPIAGDTLPEIPAEGVEIDEAFDALTARKVARERAATSSRLGGALLLAGLGILVAVVLVLVLSNGSSGTDTSSVGSSAGSSTPGATTTGASTGTTSTAAQAIGQVNLAPAHGGGRALGVASIIAQGSQRGIAMRVQGLAPSSAKRLYVVWLYNSQTDARRLGYAPAVAASGQFQATALLPSDAARFHQLIVTRETATGSPRPGAIVLAGSFALPAA